LLGGLVPCRMAMQLHASQAVEVSGVLTICSPLSGVPLLGHISEHYHTLCHFLQNASPSATFSRQIRHSI
jgi:hypothetical protein